MQVEPGDVVQIDGGLVIVTAVKDDKATVAPVSDFNGKNPHALRHGINRQITNNRLFERRGKAGLDDFLKEQAAAAKCKGKGLIKLEPGDKLCHGGEWRTVTAVTDKTATIGSLDGQAFMEDRLVNEFLLTECCTHKLVRLNAEERAENLKQFLSQRKSPLPETETSDTTETPHIEVMSTATTPKTRAPRKRAAKPTTKPAAAKSAEAKSAEAKGKIFGFAPVRIVQAAGKAGIAYEKLAAFLKAKGAALAESTVKQNMNKGKKNIEGMATLDKAQLAEINA